MAELDNPAWWALVGHQRALGRATPVAARFDPDVSPFGAFEGAPTAAHWEAMAVLCNPGSTVALITVDEGVVVPPTGWTKSWEGAGVQMVAVGGLERHGPEPGDVPTEPVVALGADDVPDMLDLVEEARPGPFSTRTVEFGGYVGIRRDTRLVAMAGERLRPPGFTEVSAVATAPGHRRQGLAELLIRSVASSISARGETPFLHAAASNENAIRLYKSLGFTVRRRVRFSVVAAPERP
jgi:ribosomal protein S18 acetylase RimI-like enzyme